MSMRMNELLNLRLRLADYVKGWTAHALLKQSLTGEDTVSIGEFALILKQLEEPGGKIALYDVIKRIVEISNARDAGLPWDINESGDKRQEAVIHSGGQVFHVDITQKKPDLGTNKYLIDIKQEFGPDMKPLTEESLLHFHKPGIEGGETTINFAADGGYTIQPGATGTPIKDTAFPPRPLQLNAVRAFAKGITAAAPQGAEYSQLALLGTGTGKSFIIASVAEAARSSVTILPTGELASDMLNDAMKKKIFSGKMQEGEQSFEVNGTEVKVLSHYAQVPEGGEPRPPFVVLSKDIESVDIFRALVERDDVHIILNTDGAHYKEFLPFVNNKLLLIDESHQHAYTADDAEGLRDLADRNVTYALTGTPTGPLFNVFGKGACAEFNLHDAMDAYLMRKLDGEDRRLPPDAEGLVDAAVLAHFKPVYLHSDDPGYVPAEIPTIETVQANLAPSCPKAMVFSDDEEIRQAIQRIIVAIESGTLPSDKLAQYQEAIRESRMAELAKQLRQSKPAIDYTVTDLERAVPPVDLRSELKNSRLESLKNTVFSFAMSQLFKGEDREKFASLLRSNAIASYPWTAARPIALGDDAELIAKIDELTAFKDILPAELQTELKEMIKEVTVGMAALIRANHRPAETLSDVAEYLRSQSDGIKIRCTEMLHTYGPADVVSVDKTTPLEEAQAKLASLRYGLSSMSISDERWATGVSIEDVLTSMVVTKRLNFEEHNAVGAPLGAAQAVGRAVRAKDLRGKTTMIVSDDVPEELVFSVSKILAKDSGEQSKRVLHAWDRARAAYSTAFQAVMSSADAPISEDSLHDLKQFAYQQAYKAAVDAAKMPLEDELADERSVGIEKSSAAAAEGSSAKASIMGFFKQRLPREETSVVPTPPPTTPGSSRH